MAHPLSTGFREQARACVRVSPLYAALLTAMADDLDAGGVTAAVLAGCERDRPGTVPQLRLLGALHRLVLVGRASALARHYPDVGGTAPPDRAWPAARETMRDHLVELRELVGRTVQTNEPGRAAGLYGGLLVASQRATAVAAREGAWPAGGTPTGFDAAADFRPAPDGTSVERGPMAGSAAPVGSVSRVEPGPTLEAAVPAESASPVGAGSPVGPQPTSGSVPRVGSARSVEPGPAPGSPLPVGLAAAGAPAPVPGLAVGGGSEAGGGLAASGGIAARAAAEPVDLAAAVDPAAAVYQAATGAGAEAAAGGAVGAGWVGETLPVRLLEVGASAGLTMLVDRYAYAVGHRVLGDPGSDLRFDQPWVGVPPADVDAPMRIAQRRGCDPNPIDPTSDEGRLTLMSYVWPDWTERVERLEAALRVAAGGRPPIDRAGAADWLTEQLRAQRPQVLTVVWHSVVWQYVDFPERTAARAALLDAAARATPDAPLAHLRFEPRRDPERGFRFELLLTLWPGDGRDELLAFAPGHGIPTRWQPSP